MAEQSVFIPVETLKNFIRDVHLKAGLSPEDAETCTKVIIESDIRGIESHGIGRLKYYYERIKRGQHKINAKFEVVKETPTTAVVDGHDGLGMLIGTKSMQMAIDKAKQYGMGCVVVRNSSHFGIAGYYPTMAAKQGMIGFCFTNARPSVSPTFGVQPMLGTNPIAFACPTDEEFIFNYDGATPIVQRGKIEVYDRKKKQCPPGWLIDDQSQPLTDPTEALSRFTQGTASFLPLGGEGELLSGHKGYGLGTMVEILCASLQSGAFLLDLTGVGADGKPQPFKVGHFFMAINIEFFVPLAEFKVTTGKILRELRASKKAPGQPRIYTAGEKAFENSKLTAKRGVEANQSLQQDIKWLQKELDLGNPYGFTF